MANLCGYACLPKAHVDPESLNPWLFPSVDEYTAVLENAGMRVTYAALFDRPTSLDGGPDGMSNWIRVFGDAFLNAVTGAAGPDFFRKLNELAAPKLLHDGAWSADYRRLRIAALKR